MRSFSIQAQGETSPLSHNFVLKTLQTAQGINHSNAGLIRAATEQLKNWERDSNYFIILKDIYTDQSIPEQVRLQSVIQLKNGIDRHWRKTSSEPIKNEQKKIIRDQVINAGAVEPSRAVALQNALIIAKISRFDFPHDWPDLTDTLVTYLLKASRDQHEPLDIENVLLITLHIIKELSTARLARSKANLQRIAPKLLDALVKTYIWASDDALTLLKDETTDKSSLMQP